MIFSLSYLSVKITAHPLIACVTLKDLPCITSIATTTACGNCLTLKGIITIVTIKEEEDVFYDCSKDANDATVAPAAMPFTTLTVVVFAENIQGTSGDNLLNGTSESDTINAFEGDDKLFGEGDEY